MTSSAAPVSVKPSVCVALAVVIARLPTGWRWSAAPLSSRQGDGLRSTAGVAIDVELACLGTKLALRVRDRREVAITTKGRERGPSPFSSYPPKPGGERLYQLCKSTVTLAL